MTNDGIAARGDTGLCAAASNVRSSRMSRPPHMRLVDDGRSAASKAIETVVKSCGTAIRAAAGRFGFSDTDTDELTQEIRIRLWNFQKNHGDDSAMPSSSYVYGAAMSAAVDMLRRRRAARSGEHLPLEVVADVVPSEPTSSVEELARALESALAAVPVIRRPTVRLHLSGCSLDEIASITGNTSSSTRNLLYRGLADLKAALQEASR